MYYFDVETRMECVHQMFHHSIWLQALLQLKKQWDIHSKQQTSTTRLSI